MGSMKRNEGIHRHDISDKTWEQIKELLPGQTGKRGGAAKDSHLFIDTADAHGRSAEGYAARIREPEQHAQAVLPPAEQRNMENAGGRRNRRVCRGYPYDRFDVYQSARGNMRGARRQSGYQPHKRG
jgi:hypothetical protein